MNELTKEEYLQTFHDPMRFVEADDDSFGPFPIGEYVSACINQLSLPTTRRDIEIHYVYMNDKDGFCHVLLHWGHPNVYVDVVTIPSERRVHGHYLLDLNLEYGLFQDRP